MSNRTTSKPGTQIAKWEDFQVELIHRDREIESLLPQHVTKQRFINSAVAAVKQNPDLLTATPRSLFAAVTKAAQDGLIPDGREGVITIYREKQRDNSYKNVAQWNPMTYGLRKRAKELDGIFINAQVVYENDTFERIEGDDPKIDHRPAPLGQDRGEMIGAYAIFRNENGIVHREVMDGEQIETVRQQSKAPNSLMWAKFTTEAWRKTVIRRGIKSVPCSEPLETVVRRDDDLFNFDPANGKTKPQAAVVQPPANGEKKALPPVVGEEAEQPEDLTEATDAPPHGDADIPADDDHGTETGEVIESELSALLEEIKPLASNEEALDWSVANFARIKSLDASERRKFDTAFLKRQGEFSKKRKAEIEGE